MTNFLKILVCVLTFGVVADRACAADINVGMKDAPLEVIGESNPFAGFSVGVNGGGQFTSIAISGAGYDELFDGISNDGFVGGGHIAFNACFGRICFGPHFEGGWSNGETTFADVDLLKFKSYRQLVAVIGTQAGKSTFVSIHGGYEWQDWEAGAPGFGEADIDVGMWAFGGGIDTMVADQVSLGVKVDYLTLDSAEADGLGDLSDALEDSEALRIQAKLSYRPNFARPSLESLRLF